MSRGVRLVCAGCGVGFRTENRYMAGQASMYCSEACLFKGMLKLCECEHPIPDEDTCGKCGRDLERQAA